MAAETRVMENCAVENRVCSSESVSGAEDVWSGNLSDASSADHLVVMVHGILGSSSDWKFGAEQFVRILPDKVFVHCSERNMAKLSLDGVDVMGERLAAEVPFLFGVPVFEKVAGLFVHWIFKRTGRHLFLTDDDGGKPPLLKRMVEDDGELYFMSALGSFKRRVVYSNVGYDHIVGWRTSSIRRNSELPKWDDSLNEKYPHIVYKEHCKAYDGEQNEPTVMGDDGTDELEEELVTGLSRVSWEKIDVSFHSSRLRFAAHNLIQVKDYYMHSEGADVIQHIIDHFLV